MLFEGNRIQYLSVTDSTNLALWRRADEAPAPPEGSIIQAGFQTNGRGQQGNAWHSGAGENLLFSIMLKPVFIPPSRQFLLNKTIALAIFDALNTICPERDFRIKWPNDIIVEGRKLVGTLIENRIMGQQIELTVAGIGININQQSFPSDIPDATSIRLLSGKKQDINLCLRQVVEKLHKYYEALRRGDQASIHKSYLDHLYGFRQKKRFMIGGHVTEATICGVDEYGKLLLESGGRQVAYGMKEIAFL